MVTQADIAQRAGVTQATVSRVLSGKGYVDRRTRTRVLRTAEKLGYRAAFNNDARRLVARRHGSRVRTNVVAVLWSGSDSLLEDAWLARLLEGIETRLSRVDQQLLLTRFRHQDPRLPRNIRAGQVDGVIVICPMAEWRPLLSSLEVPVVDLGNQVLPSHVCSDDCAAGRVATEHLLSLGHRRIAFLSPSPVFVPNSSLRRAGYEQALQAAGVPLDPGLVAAGGELSVDEGRRLFQRFWPRRPDVTAILGYNDEIARGILEAADAVGIQVPKDFSVVGVDDMPWSTMLKPPLTTLRLPLQRMGEAAAELLLRQIRLHFGGGNHGHVPVADMCRVLPAELVVRESTGPPSRSAEVVSPE